MASERDYTLWKMTTRVEKKTYVSNMSLHIVSVDGIP